MRSNLNKKKMLLSHIEKDQVFKGYWKEDIWERDECPFYKGDIKSRTNKSTRFDSISNEYLKNEAKYYLFKKLKDEELSIVSVFGYYGTVINFILGFLNKHYSQISSITEIPKEELLLRYQTYCIENGKRIVKEGRYDQTRRKGIAKTYEKKTEYVIVFNQFYDFCYSLYDERDELEKDIWDVRNLNLNSFVNSSNSDYKMDFSKINIKFRELAKKYIKLRLIVQQNLTWSSANFWVRSGIVYFFNFISGKYPDWKNLNNLKREDIEDYIYYTRNRPTGRNLDKRPSNDAIMKELGAIESFLNYIQQLDWKEAPKKSISQLILQNDKPKKKKINPHDIKYVPDDIWEQVVKNIDKMDSKYVPIILLLEASGFRISDVCCLKIDCLEERKDGWWLVGDQRKVKELNHRVPISKEIASVVKAQQELTKKFSNLETNPDNYLFPTLEGKRKGKPISKASVIENLRKLAHSSNITDKNGEIYYFKGHAFRHRYAVNLINNGMNILHVQKLMAHASPEMTLVYAQIHDNTLRKEWEKAKDRGAVRLDSKGSIVEANLEEQAIENGLELEWIRHNLDSVRLDHGFCIKSPKVSCDFLEQVVEPPCIKNNCRSFHVDRTFLDYYNEQINKLEKDIEIYKQSGRVRSIELAEKKLSRYKEIRDGLANGEEKFGLAKSKREYVGQEREGNINGK